MEAGPDAGAPAELAEAPGDDAAPAGAEPAAGSGGSVSPGRLAAAPVWTAAMAVLLAALAAGAVAAVVFVSQVRHAEAAAGSRQAAVAAARKAVADLTTADYHHPQQYAGRLKADATGKFLALFSNSATGFQHLLAAGKVQTSGHVAVVGVQRAGPGTVQLSVLAYVTVKNSQTPNGSRRVYRLSVSMISAGSHWLISNVEFVK